MLKLAILSLAVIAGIGLDAGTAQAGHFKSGDATPQVTAGIEGKHCGGDFYYDAADNACELPDPPPPPYYCVLPNGTHPTDCYAPGHTIDCSGGHKTNNGTMTSCQ